MDFDWDEKKNQTNREKHGVDFVEAATVFLSDLTQNYSDQSHSDIEDRFIAIGHSVKNRLLLVVYCERDGDTIRIISARKATANERKQYEEGI